MPPDATADRIRRRAYEIWEREGRPHGREAEHWRLASEEIASEEGQDVGTMSSSEATAATSAQQTAPSDVRLALDEPPAQQKQPAERASRTGKARTTRSRKSSTANQTPT